MTTKQYAELNRQADVLEQDAAYKKTLDRVIEKNAINDHIALVNDCRDRLSVLAKELGADSYKVCWSISDEYGNGTTEYDCSISIQMPGHGMGSYVNANNPFEKAEASIREMHAKYTEEAAIKKRRAEEERIKQALYDDYRAQLSSTPF
jgi:hypothetical protein